MSDIGEKLISIMDNLATIKISDLINMLVTILRSLTSDLEILESDASISSRQILRSEELREIIFKIKEGLSKILNLDTSKRSISSKEFREIFNISDKL